MVPKGQIFLTGSPGSGKTTLIRKVCEELESRGIPVRGFYTEELRISGRRVGFDVVSFAGARKQLARVGQGGNVPHPKVGKYTVDISSFESVVMPALVSELHPESVIVLDEVGKMELFSKSFQSTVQSLLKTDFVIFGTIPTLDERSHSLVKYIHTSPAVQVIRVTLDNRDALVPDIVKSLLSLLTKQKC